MNTIESLMREMEEDRRQRRIAALSDTTQVDGGVWKVEPSPNACPTCLEFPARHMQKNRIPTSELQVPYQQTGKEKTLLCDREKTIGWPRFRFHDQTRLDQKWDKTHINQEKEDSPISSLSTGTFFDSEGNDFGFSAMITSGLMEKEPSIVYLW